jgi:hypothetical protein
MGVLIGLVITAIVLAVALCYLAREMRAKYGPSLAAPAQTENRAASMMAGPNDISAIEADLRTIEQELLSLQAATE